MKTLIFDNYDSFTYNIVHAVRELGYDCDVARNDEISLDDVALYDKIIISPGPGLPSEAGLLPDLLNRYCCTKSILGICLGLQAIGEHFGASLRNLSRVFHGVQTPIEIITSDYIFDNVPQRVNVGRYHSWVVDNNTIPDCVIVTAVDSEGEIMALRHKELDIHGVQFHPESILTPEGLTIIKNFLEHK